MSNYREEDSSSVVKMVVLAIILIVLLIATFIIFDVETIRGNELGVKETWSQGVVETIMQPGTYFLFPGFSQKVFHYDASSQIFVMNDKPSTQEKVANGREQDAYKVQSSEGQDMKISLNLRWRIDPTKLISIHKTVRQDIEEKIIRPVVMRVVKDEATTMKAIEAYSGEGLVKLQTEIQKSLSGSGEGKELSERGITVENFVIEHIELDPNYIVEIKGKQIATQKTLRSKEEQIAAEANALVAKATAQAEYNTKLVGAQLLATNMVIAAQAENEKAVIAAKAEQQKVMLAAEANKQQSILEADGKKQAQISLAEGVLAMGKAEAEAKKLQLEAWAVPGADAFVKVEISKNVGVAFGGIKGYLPGDMKVNLLTGNFVEAVDSLTGNPIVNTTPKQ